MKKRIKRKLHKRYLEDIVIEISQSSLWRKRLFETGYEIKVPISIENVNDLPKYISFIFRDTIVSKCELEIIYILRC